MELGETSGRVRDDQQRLRHGARSKRVFLYSLRRDARRRLREGAAARERAPCPWPNPLFEADQAYAKMTAFVSGEGRGLR
jgi:hypothetical protein